jgi:hypothetical protein
MKTRAHHTKTRIHWMSLALIAVYLFGIINAHFFVHPHTVDGRLIVHSHPYQKQSGSNSQLPASHQHSAHGYLLVQTLDNSIPDLPAEAPGVCVSIRVVAATYAPEVVSLTLSAFPGASLWRAPPLV